MIRKLLQKLFGWPCDHDWETLLNGAEYIASTIDLITGRKYVHGRNLKWLYRCKKCLKRKEIRTLENT